MNGWKKEFFFGKIFKNVLSLSGAQVGSYIFPIITLPYLARVLGPSGFGMVAFAQSFALCISLPVEYGFMFSGTRLISQCREDKDKITETLSGAICVKIILSGAVGVTAYLIHGFFPLFRDNQYLFWSSVFFGISFYSSMLWYYEGLEKMRIVAVLDIFTKGPGTVCIFLFIHDPLDAWKVLIFQGIGFLLVTLFISISAWRNGLLKIPSFQLICRTIKMGWSMFVFRGAESFYQMGAAFLLGIFAPPAIVGYYSGAERIAKIFLGLMLPINRALFPKMSSLIHKSRDKAAELFRFSLFVSAGFGLAIFLIVNLLTPLIVKLILGGQYNEVVPVLRILSLLPFLVALKQVFGFQWMVAMGMDKTFNAIIITSGIFNLIAVVIVVPLYYQYGMAYVITATEFFVFIFIYLSLSHQSLNPLFQKH